LACFRNCRDIARHPRAVSIGASSVAAANAASSAATRMSPPANADCRARNARATSPASDALAGTAARHSRLRRPALGSGKFDDEMHPPAEPLIDVALYCGSRTRPYEDTATLNSEDGTYRVSLLKLRQIASPG
jgi:hypothetical protein